MLQLLFFALLREQLGCAELQLSWSEELATTQRLRAHLRRHFGPQRGAALADEQLVVAVNQYVVHSDTPLQPGDEVAFYMPVSGG